MTALVASPSMSATGRAGLLETLRQSEPTFYALALVLSFSVGPTLMAAYLDQRDFMGLGVWVKPLKFEIALAIYVVTLAFFARFLPESTKAKRWYRIYTGAVVLAVAYEIAWIAGAAMLGTASHFNTSMIGQIAYAVAGISAVLLTTPATVYAIRIARNRATGLSPVLKEGIVAGLGLVLPLTLITAGTMSSLGGHFVGGSGSDAGGLPLMGWSRDGGDLRVAHFFATHALHFIPLFALGSASLFGRDRRLPLRLFTLAFTGFVLFTFVQALMGMPLIPA